MSEMIERVARAILDAANAYDVDTAATSREEVLARAAIEAMRKPTKEMFDHAMPHMDSWFSNVAWWNAMLDGATGNSKAGGQHERQE